MTSFSTADIPDIPAKRVIVTGANSGIGRATARVLAAAGADVTLAVRDLEKGRAAAVEIPGKTFQAHVSEIAPASGSASGADTLRLCVHCGLECNRKLTEVTTPSVPNAPIISLCKS